MKTILLTAVFAAASFDAGAAAFSIDRIDPPHWWTGMKDTSLQLQIYGHDLRAADFYVDYPGVRVDSVVRLDGSPDWQFVYLDISPETRPGEMTLLWTLDGKKISKKYELRSRRDMKGARGFDAGDVLYMIMPDRFSDGNPDNNVLESMNFPAKVDRTDPNVRHGGDLRGLMDHVDYLDSLGVTAVWLNPVLENDMPGGSYHGYATTDYYAVDPRFGSNDDYTELIDTLHSRGLTT